MTGCWCAGSAVLQVRWHDWVLVDALNLWPISTLYIHTGVFGTSITCCTQSYHLYHLLHPVTPPLSLAAPSHTTSITCCTQSHHLYHLLHSVTSPLSLAAPSHTTSITCCTQSHHLDHLLHPVTPPLSLAVLYCTQSDGDTTSSTVLCITKPTSLVTQPSFFLGGRGTRGRGREKRTSGNYSQVFVRFSSAVPRFWHRQSDRFGKSGDRHES